MMKRYEFSGAECTALEKLRVPLAVYQFLNKRVVTVLVSDGFVELLGYRTATTGSCMRSVSTFIPRTAHGLRTSGIWMRVCIPLSLTIVCLR